MSSTLLADRFTKLQPELLNYLVRLVTRVSVAEELCQDTAVRLLEHPEKTPPDEDGFRAWCFRIASNLGLDHLRKRGTLRETTMLEARELAVGSPQFMTEGLTIRGTAEAKTLAREHLVVCFSCTLGQLQPEQAAALLLKEVFDFKNEEIAEILEARFAQVKHWLQAARATMEARYQTSCALIAKQGLCYQCVELDEYHGGHSGTPLPNPATTWEDRLSHVRHARTAPTGKWTKLLNGLLEELC
jgi:RNA polymerase sigma-70 factor, ECF subfamily